MKNPKNLFIMLFCFVSLQYLNISAQGIQSITGDLINVSSPSWIGETSFTVNDNESGNSKEFTFFIGQFDITDHNELINKRATVEYYSGKAPMSIGINLVNEEISSVDYFENMDEDLKNNEQYNFIGLYKGAEDINGHLYIIVEGANGRIARFAIPEGIDKAQFDEKPDMDYADYNNQEIVVTYVLLDENIPTNIILYEDAHKDRGPEMEEEFEFVGIVTDYSDSGLGPYYNISIKNENKTITTLIYTDFVKDQNLVGKKVSMNYVFEEEYNAHDFYIYDQTKWNTKNNKILKAMGTYDICEIGDMGGYLYITTPERIPMNFKTEFSCPSEKGIEEGEGIIVEYTVKEIINPTALTILK